MQNHEVPSTVAPARRARVLRNAGCVMMVCGPLLILAIMILTIVVGGARHAAGVEDGTTEPAIPRWLFRLGGFGGMALMAAGFALFHAGRARMFAVGTSARVEPGAGSAATASPTGSAIVLRGGATIEGGLHASWPLASLSIAQDALRVRLLWFAPEVFERGAVDVEVRAGTFRAGIQLRHRTRPQSAVFLPMSPEPAMRALRAAGYLA